MTRRARLLLPLLSLIVALPALAVPRTLPYQGILQRDGLAANSNYDLRFAIFRDAMTDASCLLGASLNGCGLWAEEQTNIRVSGGRFSVALGSATPLNVDAFRVNDPYLAIAVRPAAGGAYTLLAGRQRLGAAPFAIKSEVGVAPVGAVMAWHRDLLPVGQRTLDPDGGWVPCDGRVISDPESPLNGMTIPDLNGQGRFLRGGTNSGVVQSDQIQSHRHNDAGHSHSVIRPPYFDQELGAGSSIRGTTGYYNVFTINTDVGHANITSPTDDGPIVVRAGAETRPVNMSVIWIMRIK
ncbi:MAG: hypothetical protein U1E65_08630 [Myxococcota bacterium]